MNGTVLNRLLPTIGTAFGLQAALAAVFVPLQTEKYYDLGGSVGFLSTAFVSLYAPYLREKYWLGNATATFPGWRSHSPRQLLLTGALCLWAGRLGTFLVRRVFRDGKDSRFDEIKYKPTVFFGAWMAQATWISLVGLPVWVANALPASAHPALGRRDLIGLALASGSFLFEVVADHQKSTWRHEKGEKKHDEAFISRGLWSISRHPNYVGEVGIWTGVWILASAATRSSALPWGLYLGTAISPIFTYFLLTKVSGVPMLEKASDKKFKEDIRYQDYKSKTPIFFPWGPAGDFKG